MARSKLITQLGPAALELGDDGALSGVALRSNVAARAFDADGVEHLLFKLGGTGAFVLDEQEFALIAAALAERSRNSGGDVAPPFSGRGGGAPMRDQQRPLPAGSFTSPPEQGCPGRTLARGPRQSRQGLCPWSQHITSFRPSRPGARFTRRAPVLSAGARQPLPPHRVDCNATEAGHTQEGPDAE